MVKHDTYQNAESLKAVSLSKLENMIHNNSIFNGRRSFIVTNPTCAYNHPNNLHLTSVSPLQLIFISLFHSYFLPTDIPFFYTSAIFYLSIFAYSHPYSLHQKYFPYLSYLANLGCVKGPMSKGVL